MKNEKERKEKSYSHKKLKASASSIKSSKPLFDVLADRPQIEWPFVIEIN